MNTKRLTLIVIMIGIGLAGGAAHAQADDVMTLICGVISFVSFINIF